MHLRAQHSNIQLYITKDGLVKRWPSITAKLKYSYGNTARNLLLGRNINLNTALGFADKPC